MDSPLAYLLALHKKKKRNSEHTVALTFFSQQLRCGFTTPSLLIF